MDTKRLSQLDPIQALRQDVSQLGIAGQIGLAIGLTPGFQFGQVFSRQLQDARILFINVIKGKAHNVASANSRFSRVRPRNHSFSTLSTLRFIRSATWGNVSPSK